jgi:hypothetical protein
VFGIGDCNFHVFRGRLAVGRQKNAVTRAAPETRVIDKALAAPAGANVVALSRNTLNSDGEPDDSYIGRILGKLGSLGDSTCVAR